MNIREGLSFDDVLLCPKQGVLEHRADASLHTRLINWETIDIPIISANMKHITGRKMASAMFTAGGYGIIHRFQSIEDQVKELEFCKIYGTVIAGAAIGLGDYKRFNALRDHGCSVFCLDVAHGDCVRSVTNLMLLAPKCSIIAGNIATYEAAIRLINAGAASLKVGIGPGAACTTREMTGFGIPQLTAIMDVRRAIEQSNPRVTLIADGGIKNSGDIVKALAAGADTVMIGRLLAGCDETPEPGKYAGSASFSMNGSSSPEGVEGNVELSGPVEKVLEKLAGGIRSGISYAGARNIAELRQNAEWIKVSSAGRMESGVRI